MNYIWKYLFVSLTILAILVSLIATTLFLQNNEGASFVEAQSLPPKIDITHVGSTTTIVQWDTIPTATHYYIFICDWAVKCIGKWHEPITETEKQTIGIINLKPNNDYSITALAYNKQWSKYSNWKHIKTRKSGGDTISRRVTTPTPDLSVCDWRPTGRTDSIDSCHSTTQRTVQNRAEYECGPTTCTTSGNCTKGDTVWRDTSDTTTSCSPPKQYCDNGRCTATSPDSCTQNSDCTGGKECRGGACRTPLPTCTWTDITGSTKNNISHTCSTSTRKTTTQPQQQQRCGPTNCQGGCSQGSTQYVNRGSATISTITCPAGQTCTGTACTTTTTTACTWEDTGTAPPLYTGCSDGNTRTKQLRKQQTCGSGTCTGTCGGVNKGNPRTINTGDSTTEPCPAATPYCTGSGECTATAPSQCTQDSDCTGDNQICLNNGVCAQRFPNCYWIKQDKTTEKVTSTTTVCLANGDLQTTYEKTVQWKCGPSNCIGQCSGKQGRNSEKSEPIDDEVETETCVAGTECSNSGADAACVPTQPDPSPPTIKKPDTPATSTTTYPTPPKDCKLKITYQYADSKNKQDGTEFPYERNDVVGTLLYNGPHNNIKIMFPKMEYAVYPEGYTFESAIEPAIEPATRMMYCKDSCFENNKEFTHNPREHLYREYSNCITINKKPLGYSSQARTVILKETKTKVCEEVNTQTNQKTGRTKEHSYNDGVNEIRYVIDGRYIGGMFTYTCNGKTYADHLRG